MYVVDDVNEAYEIVEEVVKFAGDLPIMSSPKSLIFQAVL